MIFRFFIRLARWVCLTVFLSVLCAGALWIFFGVAMFRYDGTTFNRGQNAVWAEHAWVELGRSQDEVAAFMRQLSSHDVRYVFLHVGPLLPDGSVPEDRFEKVRRFVKSARAENARLKHDVVFLAWLGQLRSKIPLQDSAVRARVVTTGRKFLEMSELDGIHYDIEPVVDGDEDFLRLLDESRVMMDSVDAGGVGVGSGKLLSVALPEFLPFFTGTMYKRVVDLSDQLVVMTYENSISDPFLYRMLVKYQVMWLTRLVSKTRVLIGVPTYDTPSVTFHPEAENIENGLLGVIDGLNVWRSRRSAFEGVALYGFWTTDEGEWRTFDRLFGIR